MNITLEEYEQLHDLQCGGMKLVQNIHGFRYGTDAVLLSDFVRLKSHDKVLDFCSGSGIIPVLLCAKAQADKIVGLEIEQEIVESARKTVIINGLENSLEFVCGDINNASKIFDYSFDVITCNPPYSKNGSGKTSHSDKIAKARHELACTLEDVVKNAAKVLKYGGRFYLVHKAERLIDVVDVCRKYKLEPKEIKFVYTGREKNAELVMVCAVLGGGVQVKVLPPLIME